MSEIGVGLVGYRLMGRVHSNAYRQVARFYGVRPTFKYGYRCQAVLDAVERSVESRGWTVPAGYEPQAGEAGANR